MKRMTSKKKNKVPPMIPSKENYPNKRPSRLRNENQERYPSNQNDAIYSLLKTPKLRPVNRVEPLSISPTFPQIRLNDQVVFAFHMYNNCETLEGHIDTLLIPTPMAPTDLIALYGLTL